MSLPIHLPAHAYMGMREMACGVGQLREVELQVNVNGTVPERKDEDLVPQFPRQTVEEGAFRSW